MNDIPITVVGRLVAEPTLRTTATGAPMTTFRIATNSRRPKPGVPGEYEDGPTSYFNVAAFRALGANLATCLHRGEPVIVHGTLEIAQFDRQDGTRGSGGDIVARSVGHDLNWGLGYLRKVSRGGVVSETIANDPHLQAATAAALDVLSEGVPDPDTVDYDVVSDGGVTVDQRTGEILERARSAA